MLEDQLDLVLTTQRQRRRQHKAEQAECERTIHEAHTGLERMQAKFSTEVRPLIEQVVARANRHLETRPERCQLAEISGNSPDPSILAAQPAIRWPMN